MSDSESRIARGAASGRASAQSPRPPGTSMHLDILLWLGEHREQELPTYTKHFPEPSSQATPVHMCNPKAMTHNYIVILAMSSDGVYFRLDITRMIHDNYQTKGTMATGKPSCVNRKRSLMLKACGLVSNIPNSLNMGQCMSVPGTVFYEYLKVTTCIKLHRLDMLHHSFLGESPPEIKKQNPTTKKPVESGAVLNQVLEQGSRSTPKTPRIGVFPSVGSAKISKSSVPFTSSTSTQGPSPGSSSSAEGRRAACHGAEGHAKAWRSKPRSFGM